MSAIESPALGWRDREGCFRFIKADRLISMCAALLRAVGVSEEEAQAVATGCVNANLAGHDSHGVPSIPYYIDCIKAGDIVPGAEWTVVQEPQTTAVIANPIPIATLSDLEAPFVLDMATSAVAAGKIFLAVARGEKIPKGWIIDGEGRSTTDPRDYRKGNALLPLGASEGYCRFRSLLEIDTTIERLIRRVLPETGHLREQKRAANGIEIEGRDLGETARSCA